MSDIEAGAEDAEITLGTYTSEMAKMGFNVLDANGNLRDMGDIVEEIGNNWESLSREQQISLAQTIAGTRQYANLISLFDNWDQYTAMMDVAANAEGTLQSQQDIYMESTSAHLAQLDAAWEDLYDSMLNSDAINTVSDAFTNILKIVTNLVDALGGGLGVLKNIAPLMT